MATSPPLSRATASARRWTISSRARPSRGGSARRRRGSNAPLRKRCRGSSKLSGMRPKAIADDVDATPLCGLRRVRSPRRWIELRSWRHGQRTGEPAIGGRPVAHLTPAIVEYVIGEWIGRAMSADPPSTTTASTAPSGRSPPDRSPAQTMTPSTNPSDPRAARARRPATPTELLRNVH